MAKTIKDDQLILDIIINGDSSRKQLLDLQKSIDSVKNTTASLRKELSDNKDAMDKMKASGKEGTKGYKDLEVNARGLQSQIDKNNEAIRIGEQRIRTLTEGLSDNQKTVSDLRREYNQLIRLRNASPIGSDDWIKYSKDVVDAKNKLDAASDAAKHTGESIGKLADITVSLTGLKSIASDISSFVLKHNEAFAAYSDVLANARKTTGLTADEIERMSEDLKKVDTRTSQEELMGLVQIAGKLGVEGYNNILGFARAGDQLTVALGEDLGGSAEEATRQVGKIIDIFKLTDELPLEQAMLKVGSTINELGAASTANEGYIVEFANRVAGVATNAVVDELGEPRGLENVGLLFRLSFGTLFFLYLYGLYRAYASEVDISHKKVPTEYAGT